LPVPIYDTRNPLGKPDRQTTMRNVDCPWSEVLRMAGWEFARPDSKRVLAFCYKATVSLQVEESCVSINRSLSQEVLTQVLTTEPDWISVRPNWLRAGWPDREVRGLRDLEYYGLIASKGLLAAGARIPDGTSAEMRAAAARLFPEITPDIEQSSRSYQAWNTVVIITADGHMQWGYGGPLHRDGLPLPIKENQAASERSRFELYLQNEMRIDIQRRLEQMSNQA
jgi:hypothetical protein